MKIVRLLKEKQENLRASVTALKELLTVRYLYPFHKEIAN